MAFSARTRAGIARAFAFVHSHDAFILMHETAFAEAERNRKTNRLLFDKTGHMALTAKDLDHISPGWQGRNR